MKYNLPRGAATQHAAKPQVGAVTEITRTTPGEITTITNLK